MKDNKNMIFYLVLTLIYIFPLILANVYYIDDMGRAMYGYGWHGDGRILATLLMQMLSLNRTIVDLFPYSTILSALIFTVSGYLTCKISGIEDHAKIKMCSFIPLVSPFILENLSYRYDCLPMSISVIACIIPFLFVSNKYIFIILSIIGLLISALTYQASLIIYPMLCIIKSMRDCIDNKNKEMTKNIFLSITSFFISFFILKKIQIFFSIHFAGRDTLVFSTQHPFQLIKNNIITAIDNLSVLNHGILKFNIFVLSALTFLSVIFFYFSRKKIINKIISTLLLLALPVTSIIIPVLLESTWWTARVLIGISFIPYGLLIFISRLSRNICTYIGTFIFLTALPIISSYSNALLSQNKYELEIARRIFNKIGVKDQKIVVDGSSPQSPEVSFAKKNFPFFNKLIHVYMTEGWWWGSAFLELNGIIPPGHYVIGAERKSILNKKCLIPITDTHHHYIIRSDLKNIVIDFNKEKCD